MKVLKKIWLQIAHPNRKDSKSFVKFLQRKGVTIGDGTYFFDSLGSIVDLQYPWLINIGNNCRFAGKLVIMTHDFSWSVIKGKTGELFGCSGEVRIGNNVFVGFGTTILKGTSIGDNCIIGAGSIVTKSVPSNEVWGGNPAHFICKTEDFYAKRKAKQKEEAYCLYQSYVNKMKIEPTENEFFEYIALFCDFSKPEIQNKYHKRLTLMGSLNKSLEFYATKKPLYSSFSDMISHFRLMMKQASI